LPRQMSLSSYPISMIMQLVTLSTDSTNYEC
jgi:hypothetical protein